VHALRLRYECRLSLNSDQFTKVETVLGDVLGRLTRWLDTQSDIETLDLRRAVSAVIKCPDERERLVRAAGADLALIAARPSASTNRRQLLPPDLLESKAGPDSPEAHEGWCHPERSSAHKTTAMEGFRRSSRGAITTIEELLHELLYTDRKRVHSSRIPGELKEPIEELCTQDILGYDADDQCSATPVARYGAFQRIAMPIRKDALTQFVPPPPSDERLANAIRSAKFGRTSARWR
jgi:hypothetical protein